MDKVSITVGVFEIPPANAFSNVSGAILPVFQSIKRYFSIISKDGLFRLKLVLPESGQLGKLTETGYHEGVLGLIQKGEADLSFFPLPLDTQRAPGLFSPVLAEDHFYLLSFINTEGKVASIYSSLQSRILIPILLAGVAILTLEMSIIIKHFGDIKRSTRTSIITALYHAWSTLFRQYLPNRLSWYCFVKMIILIIPVCIFNASFNTQAIIRNTDAKIETLQDIIKYDKTPIFIEGLSVHDLFKANVTKDYRDVYRQAISKGTDQMYELGLPPKLNVPYSRLTFILTGLVLKMAKVVLPILGFVKSDQDIYISEKPFHSALKSYLHSNNVTASFVNHLSRIASINMHSGIVNKNEVDGYADFVLNLGFSTVSRFDLYKTDCRSKAVDIDWQPLKWDGFKCISHIFVVSLLGITIIQLVELITSFIQ